MQVFKAYFKIIKKNIPQMMIYFGIFMALSIMFLSAGVGSESTVFEASKPNIAILDRDDTELTENLTRFLNLHSNRVILDDHENAIRDALFFRRVTYILVIEEGFTIDFAKTFEGSIRLIKYSIPDSYHSAYMDRLIEKYLKTYETHLRFLPSEKLVNLGNRVNDNLSLDSKVTLENTTETTVITDNSIYYFNYFGYSLLAVILLGITSFMLTFRQPDLRRRNTCSPMTAHSMNLQLIMGNVVFALAAWFLMYGMAFILFGFRTIQSKALLYGVNTLVFMLVCVGLSFLVANLIRSKNAQPAVVNVLTLSLSFISGVFVPQFLLGNTVLRIASATPTYWYVRANHLINFTDSNSNLSLSSISKELLIQLAFFVGFMLISAIIIRLRRTKPD
jgi:ABC-2 type transport system permease protein